MVLLIFACIIVFFVGLIKLVVDLIRKKNLKTAGTMTLGSLILFIVLLFSIGTSTTNEEEKQEATVAESEQQEVEVTAKTEKESEAKKVEEKEPEVKETESETEEPTTEFTYGKMTVKYLRHEITENEMGEDVLIVYYEFTNNSKDNESFIYSFTDTCFQNGVQLDNSFFHANEQTRNADREIQPGTTIEVASAFEIGDSRDTVTLEVEPWVSFTSNKLLTLELELE
jgi:hypothetical protein